MAARGEGLLLLGRTGQLGEALAARLVKIGREFHSPSRTELDLQNTEGIARALDDLAPGAVLNAAAFTDVSGAELPANRDLAFRLNRDAPAALARACRKRRIPLVHVSTDYVFDGTSPRPYREEDPTRPLQIYGLSKREGEREVLSLDPGALVVRTSTLFGPAPRQRLNYVDAILEQARRQPVVSVVEPPVSSPTFAPDLADAILRLFDAGSTGLVHAANDGPCSRLELARAVVEEAGLAGAVEVRVRPAPPSDLPRPAYSVLDTQHLASLLGGALRPWREALAEHVRAKL